MFMALVNPNWVITDVHYSFYKLGPTTKETDLDGAGDNYFFSSGDLPLNPPLKQRHHVPGRPVNSALMILFKSPHFSARPDLRKSLMTG
ncbi:hypothetical protein KIW84_020017 [Lathyrus oleraceus]|uniref:Uncharacterized protein n=1 Tax=Pisum sativum TaxID=3888 RepID=A0A9D4Y8J6_PEA|nr:hypothetical protein KIW84_020017 [Pisum sativum]